MSEDSGSAESDKDERMVVGERKVLSAVPRAIAGSSDVSESEDELADTHHHRRRRPVSKLHKTVLHTNESSPGASSIESTSSSDGEELAKSLAMQFYKIEVGERRRLMGVMEHHSMESGAVVVEGTSSTGPAHKMMQAVLGKSASVDGLSLNKLVIPSGGLCGPVPMLPGGARIAPSEQASKADQPGQVYAGTAAARMLSESVSEGGVVVAAAAAAPGGTRSRDAKDREKAFPFSITAGVEKGDKNRCVAVIKVCVLAEKNLTCCCGIVIGIFGPLNTRACACIRRVPKTTII